MKCTASGTQSLRTESQSCASQQGGNEAQGCLNIGSILISVLCYIKLSWYPSLMYSKSQHKLVCILLFEISVSLEFYISIWNEAGRANAFFHLDQRRINGESSAKPKLAGAKIFTVPGDRSGIKNDTLSIFNILIKFQLLQNKKSCTNVCPGTARFFIYRYPRSF